MTKLFIHDLVLTLVNFIVLLDLVVIAYTNLADTGITLVFPIFHFYLTLALWEAKMNVKAIYFSYLAR